MQREEDNLSFKTCDNFNNNNRKNIVFQSTNMDRLCPDSSSLESEGIIDGFFLNIIMKIIL